MFGIPTLRLTDGQVIFVELDAVPTDDRTQALWDGVRQLAVSEPALREWLRVAQPKVG